LESYDQFQDSPLLDLAVVEEKYLLAGSMSGKLVLFNTASKNVIDERKDHSKYLVKIATWSVGDSTLVATAGWDAKVHLYQLNLADAENARLGTPLATLTLPSIPETITFVKDPEASLPVLLLTRRDSTFLFYYDLVNGLELKLLGKQNLAPHSNAWVVFSPSDVQVCPTDPSIAAVATSSTPHMKLLVVRLLVPPRRHSMNRSGTGASEGISNSSPLNSGDDAAPLTQAAQARAELVVQEREEAAILINTNTMSPQTAYSTPKLAWRPDGTGIYVTSEDGVIRGFETSSGKLMVSLAAHEPGSKVRCLWAGTVEGGTSQDGGNGIECLVSGGFDQKLILWKASEI
jgi:WD40 repeat protein